LIPPLLASVIENLPGGYLPPFLRLIACLTQIARPTKNCFLTSRNPSAMNSRRLTIADFTHGLPEPTRPSLYRSFVRSLLVRSFVRSIACKFSTIIDSALYP